MAQAIAYTTVGNREDITDMISRVEPEDCPLVSMLNKSEAPMATVHEWQVDSYGNPKFSPARDGADVTNFNNRAENRQRINNRLQILQESWSVGKLQEKISRGGGTAGVSSEKAKSQAATMIMLKEGMEACIASDQDIAEESGNYGDQLRALGKFTDATNTDFPAFARTPLASIGTTSSLTEATFNAVIQSRYKASGRKRKTVLFAGPSLKNKITNFVRAESASVGNTYRVQQMASEKTVTFSVNTYESDYGSVDIIPDLFLGRTSGADADTTSYERGYLLDMDMVSLSIMDNITQYELADQGGGPRGFAEAIFTLVVNNPKALGKFA
jgi:hypothetical protein